MVLFVVGVILVVTAAMKRCWKTLHGSPLPEDSFGAEEAGKETDQDGLLLIIRMEIGDRPSLPR